MEAFTKILKLEFLTGMRAYIGIGGFVLVSVAEWIGFDVPGFVAVGPVETLMIALTALGIYEKAKA